MSKIVDDDGGMGEPWGIAFNGNFMWAVTDCRNHCVYIFNRYNNCTTCFGQWSKFEGDFFHPCGIAFDHYNNIYVADTHNHRIQKFNIHGHYILHFYVQNCIGVVVAHDNRIYVTTNSCIIVYSRDDQYQCRYDGNSKFQSLQGIALGNANQLIVADCGCYGKCSCVHILTLDGDYVAEVGRGDLTRPCHATVDSCGFLLVTDNSCVVVFDKHGKKISCFKSNDKDSRKMSLLHTIALSTYSKAIYVADQNNHQVQIFDF